MEKSGMYYLNLVLRYWFILVFFALLTALVSYFFQQRQPAMYQSSVKIFVGNALTNPDPELGSFESAERLALTYAELIRTYKLLNLVVQEVDPSFDVDFLGELVSVEVVSDTSVLNISVRDTNPERAAAFANAIAAVLSTETPSTLSIEQEQQLERIQGQIDGLEQLIDVTNEQHEAASRTLGEDESNYELVGQLTEQLNNSYSSLALLENEYQDLSNQISTIEVIDAARPDYDSLGMNPIIIAVAGAFLGIVLAVSGIIILDIFDTTLRTADDIIDSIQAPLIGTISRKKWPIEVVAEAIATGNILSTESLAQYRAILSRMLFSSAKGDFESTRKIFAIVSPQRGNGRSFSVVNLAIAAADSGLKVLLVDVDGKNPSLHQYFGLDNQHDALSMMLNNVSQNRNLLSERKKLTDLHNKVVCQYAQNENLFVLPSGVGATEQKRTIPLLQALKAFLDAVQESFGYDLVILDSSASSESPDALNLIAVTHSRILLVLETKGTTQALVAKTAEDFHRIGHEIEGVILN